MKIEQEHSLARETLVPPGAHGIRWPADYPDTEPRPSGSDSTDGPANLNRRTDLKMNINLRQPPLSVPILTGGRGPG
ncbi:MAG: hypothetical protein ACREE6_16920 [Limisphaerales bacterium]